MYGVKSTADLVKEPVIAGKYEGVKIVEISKEAVGQNNIPTITFKIKVGDKIHTHREFPVNRETIAKNISKFRGKTVEEVVQAEGTRVTASIIHIVSSFVPVDKLLFEVETWEEFIDKVIEIAGTSYETEEFRCKIVYDKKGYAGFPKTTMSPWFQNMKTKDTIVINPKYDKMIPPAPTKEMELEADTATLDEPVASNDKEEEVDF